MARSRFSKAMICCVLLLAGALLQPLAPADANSPGSITGVLYDPDGKLAPGAQIMIAAFPQPDAAGVIRESVLATTKTDSGGAFQVAVAPPVGAEFRGPTNSAELVFHVTFADGTGFWHFVPARPPGVGSHGWTWLDSDARTAASARRTSSPPLMLGAPKVARSRSTSTRKTDDDAPDVPLGSLTPRALPACPWTTYGMQWVRTGVWSRRLIPVQRVRTRARTKVDYNWSSTWNTLLDIAVVTPTAAFSAGLSYSQNNGSTVGMDPSSGNNFSQMYRMEWQYNQYQLQCLNAQAQWISQDAYQWVPSFWTGGNDKLGVADGWTCTAGNTVGISSPIWVAKTTTVKYRGWFGIGGASLSSQQENSSAHKMTYSPTAANAKLCGRDNVPTLASQVAEAIW